MIIVKGLFGGLGQNFMNPALAARCFLFISWPQHMAVWLKPFEYSTVPLFSNVDTQAIITSVTPLKALKDMTFNYSGLADLFWGNIGGCIGETSAILLLLGGLYLLIRKVINWRIPVFYIGVMAVLCYLFPTSGLPVQYMARAAALRRSAARRNFYGDRLCDCACDAYGTDYIRNRLRAAHLCHAQVFRVSRRRFLRHPYHERLHLADR